MEDAQKKALDAAVSAAFAGVTPKGDYDKEAINARSAAAARTIYDLTRALGLERQLMANAAPWKPRVTWYPLNAAGRLAMERARQAREEATPIFARKPKRARRAVASSCPHCGGSLEAAAA